MSPSKLFSLPALVLSLLAMPASAANPASGELTDEALKLEWAGSGPYVFTNVTPTAGADTVICEPAVPPLCDQFVLDVNISDEFRMKEENQRESVRIGISFPTATGQEDYDMYLYDSAGTLMGDSAGAATVQEAIVVPLKTLKNASYTVTVVPYTPLGTNYGGVVQVGKDKKSASAGLSLAPQVGSAPLTVAFDARPLSTTNAAGGYVFDFGDGSAPMTDADGLVEHTYQNDGQYLSRVRFSDASGAKAVASAAQTVFVGELAGIKSGSNQFGGALGFGALLALFGLAGLGRHRRLQR